MPLLTNIGVLARCLAGGGQGALHEIAEAALVWEGAEIVWVGSERELPGRYAVMERLDAGGRLVVPGLVDGHTHLAFGGWRADEFVLRSRGTSYQEIQRRGGGILSTVRQTRALSEEALQERCRGFLREMVRLGVTTVEAKSGYGLTVADELKLLRVYRALSEEGPVRIVPTLMGAHVVPAEFREDRAAYVRLLVEDLIPEVAAGGWARFCDVFVEEGAFTAAEAEGILERARRHGLRPKLHADQLRDGGGAALAARLHAASADHLEYAAAEGIARMAEAGVVAVTLPLATLYLRQRPFAGRPFVEAGVPVAVATDFNPGSAPSYHLPLAMTLACTFSGLTPEEALKGATIFGARAVGEEARVGSLEPGKRADFVLVDAPDVRHWLYHFRPNAVAGVWAGGACVHDGRS